MINELRVRDLGVIADIEVVLDEGLTVITGEAGAGKTLIVDALELLLGARSDPAMVRAGTTETLVEGRFFHDDNELVILRSVPANGRSRAEINGALVPLAVLEEQGRALVDLHGQHAHQSLLVTTEQRRALDRFCGVDLEKIRELRSQLHAIDQELEALGGDEQLRTRELDLWRHELREIEQLSISSVDEDEELEREGEVLQSSVAIREALTLSYGHLVGSEGHNVQDLLGEALGSLVGHRLLDLFSERLGAFVAELDDLAAELRHTLESLEENPVRLEEIRERRGAIARLRKKHGGSLVDVLIARDDLARKIDRATSVDVERNLLLDARKAKIENIMDEESRIGDLRRNAAGPLAKQVEAHLHRLGIAKARITIELAGEGIADDVTFLLQANPGEAALPLAKVASGGELSRTMLALRLVLSAGPSTLVFDEVDAGIGGEAALAVGRALHDLAADHQVIVVTHLAQVAAFADNQFVVEKYLDQDRTLTRIVPVENEERVSELARMLSGHPDSENARRHAAELLETVGGGHRPTR